MTRRLCGTAAVLLLLALTSVAWSQQYYLYSPSAASQEDKALAKDGVLVREVLVEKGDTLSGLSRKFNGHGSYYSQILLFNNIQNPNLIYAGKTLRVPVSKGHSEDKVSAAPAPGKKKAAQPVAAAGQVKAASNLPARKQPETVKTSNEPVTEISLSDLKRTDAAKQRKRNVKQPKIAAELKPEPVAVMPQAVASGKIEVFSADRESQSGQKLFERAVRSYRQEDCRMALELFDRFLSDNPNSPLAADASLYKAECYLKLSSQ